MTISVRPANRSDTARIAEFNVLMAKETEHLDLDVTRLRAGVEAVVQDRSKGAYYVAELDGSVVGQTLVTSEWSDWRNGTFWWIQSVYVEQGHRGKGVFKTLYQHIHALARKETNVCGLRLYVEKHNARAQQTYERLGMKKTYYDLFEVDFVI